MREDVKTGKKKEKKKCGGKCLATIDDADVFIQIALTEHLMIVSLNL